MPRDREAAASRTVSCPGRAVLGAGLCLLCPPANPTRPDLQELRTWLRLARAKAERGHRSGIECSVTVSLQKWGGDAEDTHRGTAVRGHGRPLAKERGLRRGRLDRERVTSGLGGAGRTSFVSFPSKVARLLRWSPRSHAEPAREGRGRQRSASAGKHRGHAASRGGRPGSAPREGPPVLATEGFSGALSSASQSAG